MVLEACNGLIPFVQNFVKNETNDPQLHFPPIEDLPEEEAIVFGELISSVENINMIHQNMRENPVLKMHLEPGLKQAVARLEGILKALDSSDADETKVLGTFLEHASFQEIFTVVPTLGQTFFDVLKEV